MKSAIILGITFLLFLFLCINFTQATLWKNRFPDPTESRLTSAAYGAGKLLAVGIEGTLLQSTDGSNWDVCYSPMDGNYKYILYTDAFYLVNSNNKIARSATGECYQIDKWQLLSNPPPSINANAQFAPMPAPDGWNKGYVGVVNAKLFYFPTGNIENHTLISTFKSYTVLGVTYGNNQWVAKLNHANTTDIFFARSSDGMIWSSATDSGLSASSDYSLGYCSEKKVFVATFSEGVASSTDGTTNWSLTQTSFQENLHSIECIGDRCVGASSSKIYSANSCDNGWDSVKLDSLDSVSNAFPIIGFYTRNEVTNSSFLVGANDGLIYTSPSQNLWVQTGTNPKESSQFYQCDEVIYSGSEFVVGCSESVLKSSDGVNWDRDSYSLSNTKVTRVNKITSNQMGLLAASADNDMIFLSDNNGASWDFNVEFELESDDDFDILNVKSLNGSWVVFASDLWPITSTDQFTPYYYHENNDLHVYNPFVAKSTNYQGDNWKTYGSDAWITDAIYLPNRNRYLGVGKGGVFSSANLYQWTRISEANGDCFVISYDGKSTILSLCNNQNSDKTDVIVKVSTDYGTTWKNYQNPCTVSNRITQTSLQCKYLQYLPSISSFAIYTDQIVGTVYMSNSSGASWRLLTFPFAMGIWNLADNKDNLFVTLTDEVLLSGAVSSITYDGPPITANLYSYSTSAPPVATFPVVGLVASIDGGESDDDDGLSGGAIAGIVIGSVFGSVVLVAFVILLTVGAIIVYKRVNKGPEDTALLLHEDL